MNRFQLQAKRPDQNLCFKPNGHGRPYFDSKIPPDIRSGKNVIVAAHGNSLRSIVMQLDTLTREQVIELNIPTGVPLLYVYDGKGDILERKYL